METSSEKYAFVFEKQIEETMTFVEIKMSGTCRSFSYLVGVGDGVFVFVEPGFGV